MIRTKFIILMILIFPVVSKAQSRELKVSKIKRLHNYYIIYAAAEGITYKIVSKRERLAGCNKIKKGKSYFFKIEEVPAVGGSEIECFTFDKRTVICKEPDIDLYTANNLQGKCITQ